MSIYRNDEQDIYSQRNEWKADFLINNCDDPNPPEHLDLLGDCNWASRDWDEQVYGEF